MVKEFGLFDDGAEINVRHTRIHHNIKDPGRKYPGEYVIDGVVLKYDQNMVHIRLFYLQITSDFCFSDRSNILHTLRQ